MRTKLILTTAALGVAGSLGAMAQVYSVNAVGYINVTVKPGFKIVANQLNAGGNTVAEVIPTAPEGTIVYTYGAAGFGITSYDLGEWTDPAASLAPGKAFFILNPGAADMTVTFVGEVPQGALSTPLVNGLNLVASQVPQAGGLSADLGYAAAEGDTVHQWNETTQAYGNPSAFDFGEWSPADPSIAVGEGFWLTRNGAGAWDRTFSVNQ